MFPRSLRQNLQAAECLGLSTSIVSLPDATQVIERVDSTRESQENFNGAHKAGDIPLVTRNAASRALGPHEQDFYERWKAIIKNHFANPGLTITKLAKLSCLSQRQLFNKVKAVTGQSPKAWLNEFRVEQAMKLLSTEAMSISRIAEETGFSSASNFSKIFRKVTGITPGSYRKRVVIQPELDGISR